MLIFMQIWGGIFYLLNKVFLSIAERKELSAPTQKSIWRIWSWGIYILGVPPWFILFVIDRKWIAAALELGGLPGMVLGFIIAMHPEHKEPGWLKHIAIGSIIIGLSYSVYDFEGIHTWSQWTEIIMIAGFLIGTYQLARKKISGYIWYILMHLACIYLMNTFPWLIFQQIISIAFVLDAYQTKRKALQNQNPTQS